MAGITATAETDVRATPEQVWTALTDPDQIEKYMFGSRVTTDWRVGSPITWAGEYEGKKYEDKGEVLDVQPGRRLSVTHYSPLGGRPDVPENYHTLIYLLATKGDGTHVTLSQDNNGTPEEAKHSTENWSAMLRGLKDHLES
jgi:uncharacterized protein YndB with AHSA1/START domain